MPRLLLIFTVCSLVLAADAAAALQRDVVLDIDQSGPAEVDLDGDAVAERVSAPLLEDGFLRVPFLAHRCGAGERTRSIGPRQERIAVETLGARDQTTRPLLAVFGSSGATGRLQTTWVHRLDDPSEPGGCPRLRHVFRFPHRTARTPRPPRGTKPGSFSGGPSTGSPAAAVTCARARA